MEAGPDVAHAIKLVPDPARRHGAAIVDALVALQLPEHRFSRHHPGFHRGVAALDLGHIEKAGGTADHMPAGEPQRRNRLEAALVEGARAISDAPAAVEGRANRRVGLEPLKLLERIEERVLVVETNDEAHRHLAVLEVIKERAAIG